MVNVTPCGERMKVRSSAHVWPAEIEKGLRRLRSRRKASISRAWSRINSQTQVLPTVCASPICG